MCLHWKGKKLGRFFLYMEKMEYTWLSCYCHGAIVNEIVFTYEKYIYNQQQYLI